MHYHIRNFFLGGSGRSFHLAYQSLASCSGILLYIHTDIYTSRIIYRLYTQYCTSPGAIYMASAVQVYLSKTQVGIYSMTPFSHIKKIPGTYITDKIGVIMDNFFIYHIKKI